MKLFTNPRKCMDGRNGMSNVIGTLVVVGLLVTITALVSTTTVLG